MGIKRTDYNRIFLNLLPKQSWLVKIESELIGLLQSCDSESHKELIIDLLEDFCYINENILNTYVENIADYIITDTGFNINTTQIVGMAINSDPCSSQWILQLLKPILTKKGWNRVKITPNFQSGINKMNKIGYSQIILIDEFIGSGQTVEGHMNLLNSQAKQDFEIKACFIAGMEEGINRVSKSFSEFKCFISLKKGISDKYTDPQKKYALNQMTELESSLLPKIGRRELKEFHLGFNQAEALYSSFGNVPNSVFPFFWWPYNDQAENRNPILIRNEPGLDL